ncbi:MAG TPA: HEPN domain-containing protein [Armatimonadetes bacterium]|nr:HEPN domain-containing protein [Armatimonadota bacterium]
MKRESPRFIGESVKHREAEELLALAQEFLSYTAGACEREEWRVAIDEGYNAAELAVKGLILLAGEDLARTQGGLGGQFGRLYGEAGKTPREWGRELHRAQQLRTAARYRYAAILSADDARRVVALAEQLIRTLQNELAARAS